MKASSEESASVVRWPPAPSQGGVIGLVAVILCLFFALLAALSLSGNTPVSLPRVVALALVIFFVMLAGIFGYLLYGFLTIRYELTVDQLSIRWGSRRRDIPLEAVQEIVPAIERLDPNPSGWQRFWPGYYVGEQATFSGLVTIVATLKARRQLLLVTRDYQYAISPERPVLFLETFAQLRGNLAHESPADASAWQPAALTARFVEAGWTAPCASIPSETTAAGRAPAPPPAAAANKANRSAALPRLWTDSVAAGLLISALLLDIAITLFIVLRYDTFPQTIAIHWDASGAADRFGSTRQVWTIPLITWLVTIANVAIARFFDRFDRFAARFILAASLAVELLALIALYWLIH